MIFFRTFHTVVNGFAVGSCHCCHIKSCFHTSFDLQAVNTACKDIFHMFYHTEILGIKNKSSSLIFKYRHVFSRTLLLHNRIFPSAGMGTGSLIGISSYQEIAEKTASGIGNTHRSVNESLNLHIIWNIGTDLANLF